MKTPVISNDKINVAIIANEIMRFMLKFGIVLCALIGTLAFTCLASRLISVGPLQMMVPSIQITQQPTLLISPDFPAPI